MQRLKYDNPNLNYSYIMAPMFGKPGRPPQDLWTRRREIYSAVSPLILEYGAKKLTMRHAAEAAYLSIGGLYYYFPDKYDLVLHGLHPETLKNRCLEFFEKSDVWRDQNIHKYYDDYLDFAISSIEFIRPSVYVALELGKDEFLSSVDSSVNMAAREFREIKRLILPGASDTDLDHIEHFLRRIMLSACLVKSISLHEVRSEMAAVFQSYSSAPPYVFHSLNIAIQERQNTE